MAGAVRIVEDWRPSEDDVQGVWRLVLDLTPTGLQATDDLRATTRWFFLADARYPRGRIRVMPAKEGGISLTYLHQLAAPRGVVGIERSVVISSDGLGGVAQDASSRLFAPSTSSCP